MRRIKDYCLNDKTINSNYLLDSLPYPFDILDLRLSRSSTGKCWLFHMSSKGVMHGFLFPGGYRLYGLKSRVKFDGTFFMECRNFQKNSIGVLSALVEKRATVGSFYCNLTLTNGITASTQSKKYVMNYHSWRKGKSYKLFCTQDRTEETFRKYFNIGEVTSVDEHDFIYLNELFVDSFKDYCNNDTPIQCDLLQPDVWCPFVLTSVHRFHPIGIKDKKFRRDNVLKKRKRTIKKGPRKRMKFRGSTVMYVTSRKVPSIQTHTKWMLIPFSFDSDMISFVPISSNQLKILMRDYVENSYFFFKEYQERLNCFLKENKQTLIHVFCVNGKSCENGCVVGITNDITDIKYCTKQTCYEEKKCNVRGFEIGEENDDYDLPADIVSIFRCYRWPFENSLEDDILEVMQQTFTRKGLVRKCTEHCGNFEMIGVRRSCQSNGSLIIDPDYIKKHQYFRTTMNRSFLAYVQSYINKLQDEAVHATYISGDCLMMLYRKLLNLRNGKDLCQQTIITQSNFHNTIHIDKCCNLGKIEQEKVMESDFMNQKENAKEAQYLKRVCNKNDGKLPKTTTCCWSLRKNDQRYVMKQYFVSVDCNFALDISSNKLKDGCNWGATFYSAMFAHCTTVPIWIDEFNNIYMKGPKEMYNFAWGSDGGSS